MYNSFDPILMSDFYVLLLKVLAVILLFCIIRAYFRWLWNKCRADQWEWDDDEEWDDDDEEEAALWAVRGEKTETCEQTQKTRVVVTPDHKRFIAEQRRLMTYSLRYDVMARDGFRCQLCGATANDGVKLHVDHIMPVSKGGKTEMSNLRTLCERCNLGKGDKIENPKALNVYDDMTAIADALHDNNIDYSLVKKYKGYAINSSPSVDRFMQNASLRKGSLQKVSKRRSEIWIVQMQVNDADRK